MNISPIQATAGVALVVGVGWILAGTTILGGLVVAIAAGALIYEVLKTNWSQFPFGG